jgi:hypothetical protein
MLSEDFLLGFGLTVSVLVEAAASPAMPHDHPAQPVETAMTARRVTRSFACVTLAAMSLAVFTACAPRAHPSPSLHTTASRSGSALIVDSVSARLVALELARTARRAVLHDWAPDIVGLNARIGALHEQLLANSTTSSTPRRVMRDVLSALEQRKAQLVVEHRQLLVKYYPHADIVRWNVAEQVAV